MHKRGLCRHAVSVRRVRPSVCLSRSWIMSKRINISSFFSPSGSHTILVFPHQTGWRYSDGNPPNGGVECRWSIGRNRDSGLIAGYWRLLDMRSAKKHLPTTKLSIWQSATHHWLSIDCWTCELRSDKNSYRRPCSVDRTVGDAPANVCDGLQHGRIRRREENRKEFNCTQWYIWSRNN